MAALSGKPGWECSEDREHFELESDIDFSDDGRARRMDLILEDLRLVEQGAAKISDPRERVHLVGRIRLLIAKVQVQRAGFSSPPRQDHKHL